MADIDSDSSSSDDLSLFDSDHCKSSEDDLLDVAVQHNKKIRNKEYFEEVVQRYSDDDFIVHFRLSKNVAESITEQFQNSQYFNYQAGKDGKLSPFNIIIIFLWFAGHQTASFRDVADRFDISLSTLFCIIKKVTYFLSGLSHNIIKWPSHEEKCVSEGYFRQKGFPGVIGAIDGTHIRIDKPKDDPDSYLNRKHFYSIQLQVICNQNRKILDIYVGYPGSVHDGRIFRTSPICDALAEKCEDNYILGDSAYPCRRHLLTPFRDNGHLNESERKYNRTHAMCRYVVEHCFGMLMQRFRQLYHLKLRNMQTMVHFIRACCVLHNLAIDDNFYYEEVQPVVNENLVVHENVEGDEGDDRGGIEFRRYIANNVINN